jgi:hypothetical protein
MLYQRVLSFHKSAQLIQLLAVFVTKKSDFFTEVSASVERIFTYYVYQVVAIGDFSKHRKCIMTINIIPAAPGFEVVQLNWPIAARDECVLVGHLL